MLSPAGQAIFVKNGFLPLTAPAPTIAKLSPTKGRAGTKVTVTGTNFAGTTSVTIKGVAAKFTVVSKTKLTFFVPVNAKTGPVTVTNPAGTASSTKFTVGQAV